MRPQEIEKIAQGVISSFSPSSVATGCGNFASGEYTCEVFSCSQDYECGGLGPFECLSSGNFDCNNGFVCVCVYTWE